MPTDYERHLQPSVEGKTCDIVVASKRIEIERKHLNGVLSSNDLRF